MTGLASTFSVRPPAVAGSFYPADEAAMQRELDRLLAEPGEPPQLWRAALVPHAGWVYSAHIAAAVLRQIRIPDTVLILCPQHTAAGGPQAVAPTCAWSIPGATVPSDPQFIERLVASVDGLQADAAPHQREHAIEVQIPLIAQLAPTARIVGITIGRGNMDSCETFAEGLAAVLRDRIDQVLLVVSSDMNHFGSDAENRRLDRMAIERLQQLDPVGLYETCQRHRITMCGLLPAVIVLRTLQQLGQLHESRLVEYATSADVSGDASRVVGYAGMLFR